MEKYAAYMYTRDNLDRLMRETEEFVSKSSDNKFFKPTQQQQPKNKNKKSDKSSSHNHPIFWMLYKMVCKEDFFKKQNDVEEMNFRIKFIETIKNEVGWIKSNKIKISQVEGEAMDAIDIPLLGAFFRAVCVWYNVPLMVIKGNIYKTILCDDSDDVPKFIIEYNRCNTEQFGVIPDDDVASRTKHARDNLFECSKPLRAISAYKVDELREIARRVGVDSAKLLKKPLYELILSRLNF
jgi:hypothetical protein